MTRIVAGSAGGRTLRVPRAGTRPTSDRVREALFSRLEHTGAVDGARVLDLYSGSGALGLEAVSRGAASAVLVDSARDAAQVARRNAADLGFSDVVDVVCRPAARYVADAGVGEFGLALIDPPYDVPNPALEQVLRDLDRALAPGATVVVERSTRTPEPAWPDGWEMARRDYGETRAYIGGPAEEPAAATGPGGLP